MSYSLPKILIIILIQVAIALVHVFRLGQIFQGQAYHFYYSYFSDVLLPFGMYFLLSLNDANIPVIRKWYVKAGLIFTFTTFVKICQFFGIEALGVTFDPFDILVYGMGERTILELAELRIRAKHPVPDVRRICYIAAEKREGYVELPSHAEAAALWNEPFLGQLDLFPHPAVHDDRITSVTGARHWIAPVRTWKRIGFAAI